jgi:hypothetical protein
MMLDYTSLKELARDMQCRVTDLLALAPANDPFYAEMPSRAEAGEWFADCWQRFGFRHGVHLRRTHYTIISQDQPVLKPNGEPYENTENDWKFLGTASLAARYRKLVPVDAFVDRRNPEPLLNARALKRRICQLYVVNREPSFVGDLPNDLVFPNYHLAPLVDEQDYLVEVWVEKSTQNDVLVPLSRRLGFNLVAGVGEMSETAARLAVARAMDAGKPLHIIYISDFDPGGRSMPVALARKVEYIISASEVDVTITLNPLALTPEQTASYRLPRTPIKETERRAAKFEARFGSGATELDALEALHPGELARLVGEEVGRYVDPTLRDRVAQAERELDQHLDAICDRVLERHAVPEFRVRYEAIIEDLAALEQDATATWDLIADDLEQERPPIGIEDVPRPRPASPVDDPLFDSRRSYLSQIDAYRAWQGRS